MIRRVSGGDVFLQIVALDSMLVDEKLSEPKLSVTVSTLESQIAVGSLQELVWSWQVGSLRQQLIQLFFTFMSSPLPEIFSL